MFNNYVVVIEMQMKKIGSNLSSYTKSLLESNWSGAEANVTLPEQMCA